MSVADYQRIEKAILYLETHFQEQPKLGDVARAAGLSEFHFQRTFSRWAGVSPKRFLQFLTAGYAVDLLRESRSTLDAAFEAGLSSGSRLHDVTVKVHAATPGEIQRRGEGMTIRYGVHDSPFGECMIAVTPLGICWLAFQFKGDELEQLRDTWPRAEFIHDPGATAPVARRIFEAGASVDLHVKGTNFQLKVWEALLRIPPGTAMTYEDLASRVCKPSAVRAVANAVGANQVSFLIPCHRVIRKSGAFTGYRWGVARKKAILAWEGARQAVQSS